LAIAICCWICCSFSSRSSAVRTRSAGSPAFALAVKVEEIPGYVFRKAGLPADLVRTADEREEKLQQIQQQMAIANAQAAGAQPAPVAAA
jgi:hypothetical protein